MRLIDANALKSYIDCGHLRSPIEVCFSELDVIRMLDKQPTIDAVPVVRCKDCMEYIPWLDGKICARIGSYFGNTKPNDFCSHGTRRSDNE